jgi:hypothetical protein
VVSSAKLRWFYRECVGQAGDKPQPADYDGDGKADFAVFRPVSGAWYIQQSRDGFTSTLFGENEDKPVAADYDGDGKADIAVYRAERGICFEVRSDLRASHSGRWRTSPFPPTMTPMEKRTLLCFAPQMEPGIYTQQ